MPLPTWRSWVGVAREATRGTPVLPTDFVPVTSQQGQDTVMLLQDQGMRGSAVSDYGLVAGPAMSTYDLSGDVFPDVFPYFLGAVLGDVTVTGAAAPFLHAFSLLNGGPDGQPPSLTVTDYDGATAKQHAGLQASEVNLKFTAEGLLSYDAKLTGFASAALASAPAPSYSTAAPRPVWQGVASVAGGPVLTLIDGNVSTKRAVNVIQNIDGTQKPYKIWSGRCTVDGKLTFIAEAVAGGLDPQLAHYLANDQPAVTLDFSAGAGAGLTQVKAQLSRCGYTLGTTTRGKDYVEVGVNVVGIANTVDAGASGGYSPVKYLVQNGRPAGTYA